VHGATLQSTQIRGLGEPMQPALSRSKQDAIARPPKSAESPRSEKQMQAKK
jgi:hypothetical protein